MNPDVEVLVTIKKCSECRYVYMGADYVGEILVFHCHHPDRHETFPSETKGRFFSEVNSTKSPPAECPLRHGSWY